MTRANIDVIGGSASADCCTDGAVYRTGLYSGKDSSQSRGVQGAGYTVLPGYWENHHQVDNDAKARSIHVLVESTRMRSNEAQTKVIFMALERLSATTNRSRRLLA